MLHPALSPISVTSAFARNSRRCHYYLYRPLVPYLSVMLVISEHVIAEFWLGTSNRRARHPRLFPTNTMSSVIIIIRTLFGISWPMSFALIIPGLGDTR